MDSPCSSSSSSSDAAHNKRLKEAMQSISKHLKCSITQELMVDPVVAEDGNTYERAEILAWLASNTTSPLDPSCPLDASRLFLNRMAKQQIDELVASGELDDEVCAGYLRRKRRIAMERAQALFDEGKVEAAAELGHTEAQGIMASRCYYGSNGVAQDAAAAAEWSRRAGEGGSKSGSYRLGGMFRDGEGGLLQDFAEARRCK
jgi:TPR repeat protein